jgi:outer membrane protein assembly factor BamB
VGQGFGGAAIVKNEVFILDRENDQQDVLRCLDLADGKELWRFAYDAPGNISHNGSRSTPAVDDKHVFTIGPFGDFYCIDRKTHKPVWQKNVLKDFEASKPNWAVAQSPLLYKDMVVIVPAGRTAGIVALKKDTGQVVWKSESCGSEQYMSAMPMKIDGVDQIVGYGNGGRKSTIVLSVDAATGRTLWKFDKWGCDIPIASPAYVGDGKVFLSGGYRAGSVMFQVKKQGAQWSVDELWRLDSQACGSQIHNPLVWKGYMYIDNNENGKNNGMVCVGLDGKVAWSSKNPNCEKGGQILADGMIYKVDGNRGTLYLVEPTPESFKVVSQAKLLDRGEDWAPLAISEGKLIIRDQGQMKCVDVK